MHIAIALLLAAAPAQSTPAAVSALDALYPQLNAL